MRVSGILAQQAEAGEVYAHGQHGLCREFKSRIILRSCHRNIKGTGYGLAAKQMPSVLKKKKKKPWVKLLILKNKSDKNLSLPFVSKINVFFVNPPSQRYFVIAIIN